MGNKNCKITVRLTPWQEQVLNELSTSLNVSYSMLVRTIIGDWLGSHEKQLYRIIDKKTFNGNNKQAGKKEDIFGEEGD